MSGSRFLIQRWEVPMPEAPDGIAIIGTDPDSEGNFLQHYFDARGVARVYKMSVRRTITGSWEICHDGASWEHDFDLTYTGAARDRDHRRSLGGGTDALGRGQR
jgi:hypothetical protein